MLNVNEYINTIRQLERQIEEYNLRMNYRKLELGFHEENSVVECTYTINATISNCISNSGPSQPKSKTYEYDAEYANLMYKRDILKKKLSFLKEHGFLPDEI